MHYFRSESIYIDSERIILSTKKGGWLKMKLPVPVLLSAQDYEMLKLARKLSGKNLKDLLSEGIKLVLAKYIYQAE